MTATPRSCAIVLSSEQVELLVQLCEAEINTQDGLLLNEVDGEIRDISVYNLEQVARKLERSLL
jgi:hypothetical protein